jgi:hypothetical protein
MTKVNSLYNAIAFGTLLTSLDKMGIKPALVARQTNRVLSPIVADLAKKIYNEEPSKDINGFIKHVKEAMVKGGFADPEKSEISATDSTINMKFVNCMYQDLANFGKSQGYAACPLCVVNLILSGRLGELGVDVSNVKLENKDNVCSVKVELMK